MDKVILVGYSGHALVVADVLLRCAFSIEGYLEPAAKTNNPLEIKWLGNDRDEALLQSLAGKKFFATVGNNAVRRELSNRLVRAGLKAVNAIDPSAVISPLSKLSGQGMLIGSHVTINALSVVEEGVICNTGCIIEHECKVGSFAHIGPGAILCGNVTVGENTFIGAGAVIKEGVIIGANVIVGAGSIIIRNIEDNQKVVGNPGKVL